MPAPSKSNNWVYLIFPLIAALSGSLAIVIVIREPNGYTGSMVFGILLLLIGAITAFLILFGLFVLATEPNKKIAASFFLAAILLPIGYFSGAMVAQTFQLGAYREEPMISLIPDIGNKVIFKKSVSEEEISRFWNETISTERSDHRGFTMLPGIRGVARVMPENDHEILVLSCFPDATEEQTSYIREKIKASPVVEQYLENIDTTPPATPTALPDPPNAKENVRIIKP